MVREDGDPDGFFVLVHNGSPNSRLLYEPFVEDAKQRGIRLVSYDRPGYGESTPHPGRTVADCAEDVRAIAKALGAERVAVWGTSGGGPHATACAALLPDIVVAVGVVASIAPYGPPDLDYFSGMGQENVDDTMLTLDDPAAARAKAERDRELMLQADPQSMLQHMQTLLSPVDAAVLTGALAEYLHESTKAGLAPGVEGWYEDSVAFVNDWGFEFDAIRVPVLLRHGREDRFVPFTHGEWLAKQIPGVEAELLDNEGHITLFSDAPRVHEWLMAKAR